jgi:hypothetical protein
MTDIDHFSGPAGGEQMVRRPRATDAVGRALRGVFATQRLPADMMVLIARLDTRSH